MQDKSSPAENDRLMTSGDVAAYFKVENLQTIADTRDRAREYAEQIEQSGNRAYAKAGRELLHILDGGA